MAEAVPYTYMDVKGWLVEQLKTILADAGYTEKDEIRVLKSDPHDAADIPCVGVNLANADENSPSVGDVVDVQTIQSLFDGAGGIRRTYGSFVAETLELRVWHLNADERDKLRVLLMAQLFNLRRTMITFGIANIRISGGRDEQDNQTLQPNPLYFAPFNISYLNPLEVWEDEELVSDITVNQQIP